MKTLLLTAAALVFSGSAALADMPTANERFAMVDAATSIAAGADRHDWTRVRNAFADQVTLDYTSLWGGEAATQAADDIIAQWSAFLPGFDETLHLVTNHTVTAFDGNTATLEADFQAAHRIDTDQWVLSGHYTYGLQRDGVSWKVNALMMKWTHETGDRGLVGRAAERTAN